MKTYIKFVFILATLSVSLSAQSYKDLNEEGVRAYSKNQYDSSLHLFEKALEERPEEKIINFNLGNSFHQRGNYDQALAFYENAATASDSLLAAESFYNIGNTHYRSGQLEKAIEAYKKSLEYNSADEDAKFNLELAMKKLEEQKQQQQKQQQQNQDQDEKDKQDQDNQNKDNQNQNRDEQKDEKQDKQDQDKKDQKDQQKDKKHQDDQQKDDNQPESDDKQKQKQEQKQGQKDQESEGEQNKQEGQTQPQEGENQEQMPAQLDQQRARALLEGLSQEEKEVLKGRIKEMIDASGYKGKSW